MSGDSQNDPTPSDYELRVLQDIDDWHRQQRTSVLERAPGPVKRAGRPVRQALNAAANRAPRFIAKPLKDVLTGFLQLTGDFARYTRPPSPIYRKFRKAGHAVESASDLHHLDLQPIDKLSSHLSSAYSASAGAEGGVTGALGAPGLFADIPALLILNLRAITHYATYYGVDPRLDTERFRILEVLARASSPTDGTKVVVGATVVRLGKDVVANKTWDHLRKNALVPVAEQVAKAIGVRLTKAKLAQFVPVAGAAVGAGFNAYYTNKICEAAYYLYRERFLKEKYGAATLTASAAEPAPASRGSSSLE